jgi:1,4-alpha-glucan branching enzyme
MGLPEKFKEFVDLCHQNGIAVILDVAFNHATGRSLW